MTTKRPDGVEQLPRRFRDYIQALESQVRDFESTKDAKTPTRVVMDPYGTKRYLPDREIYQFMIGDESDRDYARDVRVSFRDVGASNTGKGSALEITGTESLVVIPHCGNVVYIMTRTLAQKKGMLL